MRISIEDLNETLQHECMFWVRSLIESYLKGVRGSLYFCENSSIHIVCKSIARDVLEHAGQQICDLSYSESAVEISYHIYDLSKDHEDYIQNVAQGEKDGFCSIILDDVEFSNETGEEQVDHFVGAHENDTNIQLDNKKVLLVEDDAVTRWLVRNTLKDHCDFLTAPTANKVFSVFGSYQPDIVFLDINLPDKSGYEVLDWIMDCDPGVSVVMFSSNDHIDNITNAIDAGASGFIGKPFIKEQLMHYIR